MPTTKRPLTTSPPDTAPRARKPPATPPESSPARRSPAGKATARPEPPTPQERGQRVVGRPKGKQSPTPPPPTPKPKATGALNIETYAPELLLELINGKPDAQKLERLAKDFRADFSWTDKGGSWNHWQMLAACQLWHAPSAHVVQLWYEYLKAQIGEIDTLAPSPIIPRRDTTMLRFFSGTEQFSNTYEGWRWGAVLAVRLWALRHPELQAPSRDFVRLTSRYNEIQTALLALGAAPGPTSTGTILSPGSSSEVHPHTHRTGSQMWWSGPSLPMSGARSTPAHLGTDERMPLYTASAPGLLGISRSSLERFGWPLDVLTESVLSYRGLELGRLKEAPETVLSGVRLLVPHHFLHWHHEGIRLNYMESLVNGNTTSILGHVHYSSEDRAVYLFPWPGRIRSGLGPARCEIKGDKGKLRLVASSRFGEVSIDIPSREPDSHVSIGSTGVVV